MRTIVYGNGKSRQKWNVSEKLDDVVTWGCNRIFNDVKVDNLVSVDYWVQHLIYESGYALNNRCWFADWTVLPPSFTGIPIYPVNPYPKNFKEGHLPVTENERTEHGCVVNGRYLGEHKGIVITWVQEKDMVTDVVQPREWSAGTTALYLACQQGAKDIYLMGFDLDENPLNNMYLEGKKDQMPEDPDSFCQRLDWAQQLKEVFGKNPNVNFTWVEPSDNTKNFWEKNLIYNTYDEREVIFKFNNLTYDTYENIRSKICR